MSLGQCIGGGLGMRLGRLIDVVSLLVGGESIIVLVPDTHEGLVPRLGIITC